MSNHDKLVADNPILIAYRAMRAGRGSHSNDLIADYRRFFVIPTQVSGSRVVAFEKFSIIDPNIRTVFQSNTKSF